MPIHAIVSMSNAAIKRLSQIIHTPGLGNKLIDVGKVAITKYGSAIPRPIKIKIIIKNIGFWVNANVMAVPTKGAEHGVAINVARNPEKKSEKKDLFNFE